jgi:hypothetical protein
MAGYSGISMSNNAVQAYAEGKLPLSKITRKVLSEHKIHIPVEMFKWVCRIGIIQPCEWHHTSMDYNQTNFYDIENAAKKLSNRNLDKLKENYRKHVKALKKPVQKAENIIYYAHVVYDVSVGLGKKRKYFEHEDYAVVLNDWAYLVSGGKKSVKGQRFWIKEKFEVRPEQIPEDFANEIYKKIKS